MIYKNEELPREGSNCTDCPIIFTCKSSYLLAYLYVVIILIDLFMKFDSFDLYNVPPCVHRFTQFTGIHSAGEIWSCHLYLALHKFAVAMGIFRGPIDMAEW